MGIVAKVENYWSSWSWALKPKKGSRSPNDKKEARLICLQCLNIRWEHSLKLSLMKEELHYFWVLTKFLMLSGALSFLYFLPHQFDLCQFYAGWVAWDWFRFIHLWFMLSPNFFLSIVLLNNHTSRSCTSLQTSGNFEKLSPSLGSTFFHLAK